MKNMSERVNKQSLSWNFGGAGKTYVPGKNFGLGPKSYKRPDERILDDACLLLTVDPDVDATEIEVEVADGVVALSGTVANLQMKELAQKCLEGLMGVKHINNDLRVRGYDRP